MHERLRRIGDVQRAIWILVVATAVLYAIAVSLAIITYVANNDRIRDIQVNRVSSCEKTYRAFIETLRPFFPLIPAENLAKFKQTVVRLEQQCVKQTTP